MAYDLGTIGAVITLDNRQYVNAVRQVGNTTETVMGRVQSTLTRVLGAYGSYRLFKEAASAAMSFEEEIKNIGAIASDLNMSLIADEIVKLDSVLGRSVNLANAYYFAYSSRIRGTEQELAKFTESIAKLAKTIRADVTSTMDSATALMNAYGLSVKDAGEIQDWFFSIVKYGKTTGQELSNTLGLVVNAAATAKIPLDELGAAIATLTLTMPTSRALTSLNQVISSFLQPSKQARDVAKSLGIEFSATALQSKGLAAAIGEINEKAGDNIEALGAMFGEARSFRAIASLATTQQKQFRDAVVDFANKGGEAMRAFDVQVGSRMAAWQEAMTDLHKGLVTVGDGIEPVITAAGYLIGAIGRVTQSIGPFYAGLGVIGAAYVGIIGLTSNYARSLFMLAPNIAKTTAAMTSMTAATAANTIAMGANNAMMLASGRAFDIMAIKAGIATASTVTTTAALQKLAKAAMIQKTFTGTGVAISQLAGFSAKATTKVSLLTGATSKLGTTLYATGGILGAMPWIAAAAGVAELTRQTISLSKYNNIVLSQYREIEKRSASFQEKAAEGMLERISKAVGLGQMSEAEQREIMGLDFYDARERAIAISQMRIYEARETNKTLLINEAESKRRFEELERQTNEKYLEIAKERIQAIEEQHGDTLAQIAREEQTSLYQTGRETFDEQRRIINLRRATYVNMIRDLRAEEISFRKANLKLAADATRDEITKALEAYNQLHKKLMELEHERFEASKKIAEERERLSPEAIQAKRLSLQARQAESILSDRRVTGEELSNFMVTATQKQQQIFEQLLRKYQDQPSLSEEERRTAAFAQYAEQLKNQAREIEQIRSIERELAEFKEMFRRAQELNPGVSITLE